MADVGSEASLDDPGFLGLTSGDLQLVVSALKEGVHIRKRFVGIAELTAAAHGLAGVLPGSRLADSAWSRVWALPLTAVHTNSTPTNESAMVESCRSVAGDQQAVESNGNERGHGGRRTEYGAGDEHGS